MKSFVVALLVRTGASLSRRSRFLRITWGSGISLRTIDQDLETGVAKKKRQRLFERMKKRRAIPVSEEAPSSADLLAEIREEEAR